MKKQLLPLLAFLLVSACDQIGSTKIKNLIDLTPPLVADVVTEPQFKTGVSLAGEDKAQSINIVRSGIISQPVFNEKVVYTSEQRGFVTAFSLAENKELWRTNIKGNSSEKDFIAGGITYNNGKLYVANGSRFLVVIDAKTGFEEFRKEFSDIIRVKPLVHNNHLIVQTVANKLYDLDKDSYKIKWYQEGGAQTFSGTKYVAPVIHEDNVIVTYTNGDMYALNLASGSPKWRYRLIGQDNVSLPGFVPSSIATDPVISNDFMYFATTNGKLIKLSLHTGVSVWEREAYDIQSLALNDNILIVTNNARQVATIDGLSGKVTWVGNLISQAERAKKKPKPVKFTDPFVTINGDATYTIQVAANNGALYRFQSDNNGKLPLWPTIKPITNGIKYQVMSCCGKVMLVNDRKLFK